MCSLAEGQACRQGHRLLHDRRRCVLLTATYLNEVVVLPRLPVTDVGTLQSDPAKARQQIHSATLVLPHLLRSQAMGFYRRRGRHHQLPPRLAQSAPHLPLDLCHRGPFRDRHRHRSLHCRHVGPPLVLNNLRAYVPPLSLGTFLTQPFCPRQVGAVQDFARRRWSGRRLQSPQFLVLRGRGGGAGGVWRACWRALARSRATAQR